MKENIISNSINPDYQERIKRFRSEYGFTQQSLADELGVSFTTVNRWENGQTKPSQLSWNQLQQLESTFSAKQESNVIPEAPETKSLLDFTTNPEIVKTLVEGERLSFGHLMNPTFATEISSIDPLPHQRIAVYDNMLKQSRLRFLLADDAGAGKTIMSGLYIREMLARRLLRRILIITPAGLVENWRRELSKLFNLSFRIISGDDARNGNPFIGDESHQQIVSVDTALGTRVFSRLQDPKVEPYDLVIFDEAHKLSSDRGTDFRVRKTNRYKLAEAIAGVKTSDKRWSLQWSAHHLLLLTATPHMGKNYPYYALWRLLEPEILSTPEAFDEFPPEQRSLHFIRRTKEEMLFPNGEKLYPRRISDTLGYDLSKGPNSEKALYEETTEYLKYVYNKAKLLNREAARLAMSVFQRRLASSTYALMRSFERRLEKLNTLIDNVQDGIITPEQLIILQQRITKEDDVFESKTADDEFSLNGQEENEISEEKLLQGVIAASLADLLAEKEQVQQLYQLASKVYDKGIESKFEKLHEFISLDNYKDEKFIIFTEHRDTLEFLIKRLSSLGFTGQIAQIHGGMHYSHREEEVARFKKDINRGGAKFLVCTDAAGEGINLQFCWIMVNYDIPWNPARLEQRMGRIHRYGQKHDPVIIMNLVSPSTREGKVLKTLLDKLEKIREELDSEKVFDVVGRIFEGLSIRDYMEMAVTSNADVVVDEIDNRLTKETVETITNQEKELYRTNGDVAKELPRIRQNLETEVYYRLLPGYVRQYLEKAAPLLDLDITGDPDGFFSFSTKKTGSLDSLLPILETYHQEARENLCVSRPGPDDSCIWLHPGEPVFESFRKLVSERLGGKAKQGAVFVDPHAEKPYLFHLALVLIMRNADPEIADLANEETLECRLIGVKQYEGSDIEPCPVEQLLILKGGRGLPKIAQKLAVQADDLKDKAYAFIVERIARSMALEKRQKLLETIQQREEFLKRGFDFQEAELAAARALHGEKARKGNKKAMQALEEVKQHQKNLKKRRSEALCLLHREPELISPAKIEFIAHALIIPSSELIDKEIHDANVEQIAMDLARAFEEAQGATVKDVHTPTLALEAELPANPGFDLLSIHPNGERRCIEVKGRAQKGDVEVTDNEWARACNLRKKYWLYTTFDCASPTPQLFRVNDPFGKLLATSKHGFLLKPKDIVNASIVD